MSKLSKKTRRKQRPSAIAKESTRTTSPTVPTKPRKKPLTKKQAAAKAAKLKAERKNLVKIKPQIMGGSGALGLISPGKVLKGGKMVANFITKQFAKKGAAKAADKISKKS